MTKQARERGFALLIVLWTLALIALLTTHILANGRVETRLAANLRGRAEAEAAADGAVFDAAFRLVQANPPFRVARGVQILALRYGRATVAIEPEAGKINPNIATPDLLTALLRACGADRTAAATLAEAMVGWREATPQTASLALQYRAAGFNYGPPGESFETLDELGLIPGMTPALLACLSPHLSLFQDGDPDPTVADPVVLQALHDAANGAVSGDVGPSGAATVSITATVVLAGGARFVRHAVIGIGPGADGRRYRVLEWESGQL